jgi:hypothetical protein
MSTIAPVARILVGVVVERRKATSQWIDYVWRPSAVLPGVPDAQPWTVLSSEGDVVSFYAGSAEIELYRSHTQFYRDNLLTGAPLLWVALHPTESNPPYKLGGVTADPSEGEAYSETGAILVESIPMPSAVREMVEAFVEEHHVDQAFSKRKRDRANPDALGRRGLVDKD